MDLSDADFRIATERGATHAIPAVRSARYDRRRRRIVVVLGNGLEFSFRAADAEGLAGATADDLSDIEISRTGLHWQRLDADLSIEGLMAGRLGSAAWMAGRGAA